MSYNPLATFAKGCFLADTLIATPTGDIKIQDLEPGDKVLSFNEKTQQNDTSVVNKIDVLGTREYFTIKYTDGWGYGNEIKATAKHPFYVHTPKNGMYLKTVKELEPGDEIYIKGRKAHGEITNIRKSKKDVVVYNLIDVTPNHNYFANDVLVHNKGGCFADGTLISTPGGDVKIEDLKIGDNIISLDVDRFEIETSVIGDIDTFKVRGYYILSTETQTVRVTKEHPFYVLEDGQLIVRTVGELDSGFNRSHIASGQLEQSIYLENDTFEKIVGITYVDDIVRVHNLINVSPNHNYFANKILVHNKGGSSCFLPGTRIMTPAGSKKIEKIRPHDTIVSYNESNGAQEYSIVSSVQVSKEQGYYIINGDLEVTATHPVYVADGGLFTSDYTTIEVQDLKIGDYMVNDVGYTRVKKIEYIEREVKVYNLINVEPNHNYYANRYLVHNKGGFSSGRSSSSSAKSSGSKSSSISGKSTSSSTGSKGSSKSTNGGGSANKSNSRSTTSSATKPGNKITTSDGKTVQTSTKKPTSTKVNQQAGITGVDGYTPKFKNGYSAPAGSVVYYPQHSFTDYLPWIYLFSNNSPANDQATIMQPDGKQVTAPPVEEGVDGLAVFNWILLFIIGACIIGGVVWGVSKLTNKDKGSSYGSW